MAEIITYARAGGPPDCWCGLQILNRDTGDFEANVVEVDAAEGWLIRHKLDDTGRPYVDPETEAIAVERITGRFSLIPPPGRAVR